MMTANTLDTAIFRIVRTQPEAAACLHDVDVLFATLFSVREESFSEALEKHIQPRFAAFLKTVAREKEFDYTNREEWKTILPLWNDLLEKLKPLPITLAFEPSEELLEQTLRWIHENINTELIMEIRVDPSIIGGATVSFNGRYTDGSLKAIVDKYFSQLRKEHVAL